MERILGPELWTPLAEWVRMHLGLRPAFLAHLLDTLFIVVLAFAVQRGLVRALTRNMEDAGKRYTRSKTVAYLVGILAALLIARVWLRGSEDIGATLGILTAGLAIALQDPIANFAGWLFLIVRKPFSIGDRIQIGEHAGDVVDIRLFMFSILEVGNWVAADQSTGRLIHVPNGRLFKEPVANYTEGFDYIWNEIPVTVTFESDWRRARDILARIGEEHAREDAERVHRQLRETAHRYLVHFRHLTPIVWVSAADNGVTLTLRYLCPVRRRRGSASDIWSAILGAFAAEPAVAFAYPTQRFFDNPREGKPGARAPLPGEAP